MNGAGSPRNIVARLHPQIVVRGDRFMSMTATAIGESTCVCAGNELDRELVTNLKISKKTFFSMGSQRE